MKKKTLYDCIYSEYTYQFLTDLHKHCFNSLAQSDTSYSNLNTVKNQKERGLSDGVIESFIDKCFQTSENGYEIATNAIKHIISNQHTNILNESCKIKSCKNLNHSNIKNCYYTEDESICYNNNQNHYNKNCKTCSLHCLYKILCYLRQDNYYHLLHDLLGFAHLQNFPSDIVSNPNLSKIIQRIYNKINRSFISLSDFKLSQEKYCNYYKYFKPNILTEQFAYLKWYFSHYYFDSTKQKLFYATNYMNKYANTKEAYDIVEKLDCTKPHIKKLLVRVEVDKIFSYMNLTYEDKKNDFIENSTILATQYIKICDKFINEDIKDMELLTNTNNTTISLSNRDYYFDILQLHIEYYNFACKEKNYDLVKQCKKYIDSSIKSLIDFINKNGLISIEKYNNKYHYNQKINCLFNLFDCNAFPTAFNFSNKESKIDKTILFKAKALIIKYYMYEYKNQQIKKEFLCHKLFNANVKKYNKKRDSLKEKYLNDFEQFLNGSYPKQDSKDIKNTYVYIPKYLYDIQAELSELLYGIYDDNPGYFSVLACKCNNCDLEIDSDTFFYIRYKSNEIR